MLGSEIITIQVGEANSIQSLQVHKDILLKSKFFRAFLIGNFVESQSKQIVLPEDDFRAVRECVNWLYTGSTTYTKARDGYGEELWCFADKVCDEAYRNDIMDSCIDYYDQNDLRVHPGRLRIFYKKGLGQSAMAKFCLKTNVDEMLSNPTNWKSQTSLLETVRSFGEDLDELVIDLINEIVLYQENRHGERNPRKLKGCDFHEHKDGSPCSKANGST